MFSSLAGSGRRHASSQAYASSESKQSLCRDAPEDYGLLITLNEGEACRIEFVPDKHLEDIHPNGYGPASLENVKHVAGGGSGVTVFRGTDATLGALVLKHGSEKDTKELFALAKIATELRKRRKQAPDAADYMQDRLPEFRMIYISPRHLWCRPKFKDFWRKMFVKVSALHHRDSSREPRKIRFLSIPSFLSQKSTSETLHSVVLDDIDGMETSVRNDNADSSPNGDATKEREGIQLYTENNDLVDVIPHSKCIEIMLGHNEKILTDTSTSLWYGAQGTGFDCLECLVKPLQAAQKKQHWKFTLAQKQIGGAKPKTAAKWLAEGKLEGELLNTLIQEEIKVIRNLQRLSLKEEANVDAANQVRTELEEKYQDAFFSPANISNIADEFVGLAIRKNWDPNKGRFYVLRRMGEAFLKQKLTLTPEEKIPAHFLGKILQEGAKMADVFKGAPAKVTALESKGCAADTWRDLLRDAVSLKSHAALSRIWNSGVSDGGLHNMFLSQERIWLFDIGEPTCQPVPAFLTKFLFSFLHTLGMEEDDEKGRGWVNRFVVPTKKEEKLALTEASMAIIPKAYAALHTTLDRLIEELFDREEEVRELLIHFVTLQLLSDAAFCLERWATKGGGQARNKNHQQHIEEWLWRSLWDIYIASDLNLVSQKRYLGGHRRHFKLLAGLSWRQIMFLTSDRDLFEDESVGKRKPRLAGE